ncbi:MAG: hypothetical protein HYR55_01505 [Acidobacteria bacterium]|nr:hypothetical protein [Acidobacteriota bacterium]MBI3655999.1 hypothetical protein [Acidobacteriota bacterium]
MRKMDDREGSETKKNLMDDSSRKEAPLIKPQPKQPMETLRTGYSWRQYLRNQHSGWDLKAVDDSPYSPLVKPLAEIRLALITTAGICHDEQKPFTMGALTDTLRRQRFRGRGDASYREITRETLSAELKITHNYYDHTDADQDINCVFPIDCLSELASESFIGEIAPVNYSLMGYIPEPSTLEGSQNAIITGLKQQGIDAVLITPGDALSHHTAALLQREIERSGVPTVAVTVCRDITAAMKVSRAVALRFPIGNVFGHPFDDTMQFRILKAALQTLETAQKPGVIVDLPFEWLEEDED